VTLARGASLNLGDAARGRDPFAREIEKNT
jgi:hypothetical protein